jgi:glycosyltransferase involved in cell wall biosynthesis
MLSVVIPALNESEAIVDTVTRVSKVLTDAKIEPFEVIVVDDGSFDNTGTLAQEAGATVIRHPHNVGYGRSLKDGIAAARYPAIAITDADGTYPIEDLPALHAMYAEGYDMVVGARTGKHYHESILKSPLRWVLRSIVEWTAGRKIPDINSGLRVFQRDLTISHFNHLCDTFSFTTSLTLAYMMKGRFVGYRPIEYFQRIGKTRVRLFRDSLRTLQYVVEACVYYNPLKIFTLLALICGMTGIASFAFGVGFQFVTLFWLGIGCGLMSIVVFSLGLVCVLLKQIMDRPSRAFAAERASDVVSMAERQRRA